MTSFQWPRSESSRFYASCPSRDEIKTFPEGTLMDSVVEPGWTSVEHSHQWLNPSKKNKRKKKVPKLSVSGPIPTIRLSAVTEVSESTRPGTPEPVELPTNLTPRITPEKAVEACSDQPSPSPEKTHFAQISTNSTLTTSVDKLEKSVSQYYNHCMAPNSRSISMGSIVAPPPDISLPEIPAQSSGERGCNRSLSRSKSSNLGKHRRELSMISPTLTTTQTNQLGRISGMSKFDFRLNENDTRVPRTKAGVPSLCVHTNSTALQQYTQQSLCMPQNASAANAPNGDFKTIDASNWNIPRGLKYLGSTTPTRSHHRHESGSHSPFNRGQDSITTTINSGSSRSLKDADGVSSRPTSISSVDMFRLSVIGATSPDSSRKGHRRQNCVRIKNLQPADVKKKLSSQLDRLAEAEEDNSVLFLTPKKKRLSLEKPPSEASLDAPKVKQAPSLSLRVRRPGLVSKKNVHLQNKRSRDDESQSASPTSPTNQLGLTPRRAQTVAHMTREIETSKGTTPPRAKTPPWLDYSPASPSFLFPSEIPRHQKSRIQGPRSIPPPPLRIRNRSGSPLTSKSSAITKRKRSDTDIRESAPSLENIVRSPQVTVPEVNLVQSSPLLPVRMPSLQYNLSPEVKKQRKRSSTVAGHAGEGLGPNSKQLRQAEARRRDFLETPPAHGKAQSSPSNISIWEDVSVRADSPDGLSGSDSVRQSRLYSRPESVSKTCPIRLQKASEMIARFEGIENVQQKNRDADMRVNENFTAGPMRNHGRNRSHTVNTAAGPPAGIGLGLRFEGRSMAYTVNEMSGQEVCRNLAS
ncbi:hypothetical protein H2198_008085 [Neophaeococcomyces mojaviensis]|uniref:Uncharacterized protein n=1 Tax=Neophaeococcomyces mojaviensis TaxID=3383035 RepID=A0ACC2ZYB7_9EURO|nr:hypothetical protein H2198_008085 [Knufia sp. JES_112]